MAVAEILSSGAFGLIKHLVSHDNSKSSFQHIKQESQQLGSDLQAGNLSQAKTDFDALQQNLPGAQQTSTPASQTGMQTSAQTPQNSLAAAVSQLAQDLKAGNLSAAQSDIAAVQQDVQQIGQQQGTGGTHHHHHHHHSSGLGQPSNGQQSISDLFSQLGSSLQSGDLTAAQQAYSTLQQDFQQVAHGNPATTSTASSSTGSSALNVSA